MIQCKRVWPGLKYLFEVPDDDREEVKNLLTTSLTLEDARKDSKYSRPYIEKLSKTLEPTREKPS